MSITPGTQLAPAALRCSRVAGGGAAAAAVSGYPSLFPPSYTATQHISPLHRLGPGLAEPQFTQHDLLQQSGNNVEK